MSWGTIVKSVVIYRVTADQAAYKLEEATDLIRSTREQLCIMAQPGDDAADRFSELLDALEELAVDAHRFALITNAEPDELEEY